MPFSQVPAESKTEINRAGKFLALPIEQEYDVFRYSTALELTARWRASHAYPINTFSATLRNRLRRYPSGSIAAQRLKRMPTIIDKLRRYPAMQLTTMQDIAGLRAVLDNVEVAERLATEYLRPTLPHVLIDKKNYITDPRDEDGYRSIHLIYRYKNKRNSQYDGLRLELQIRSRLQHIWATAVETMGTFLGQALKSRQGERVWLDFFAIISSAFALMERRPALPRFRDLTKEEIYRHAAKAEKKLNALELMNGISVVARSDTNRTRAYSYHLMVLDSVKQQLLVQAYDRDSFEQAVGDYAKYEERAANGERIEPVLVSAGRLDQLQRAYPNFFLDIRDFCERVKDIVSKGS